MGVKLGEIVPRQDITFEDLEGKKIAIDASNTLFQFLSSIRQQDGTPLMDTQGNITSHLVGILTRFANLLQKKISLVVVFDGKPPALKHAQHEARRERKDRAQSLYDEAKKTEDTELMGKYAKQTSLLNSEMILESKELLKAMGIPIVQAPSEADAQIAYMNKQDDVYGCGSSDFDCLIHGGPRLVTNLTLSQRRKLPSGEYKKINPQIIGLKETLKELEINQDQLISLAILSGTDYNLEGVKGIGPKKALKLIKEKKTPANIFKGLDVGGDWEEIFDLFKNMNVEKKYVTELSEPNPDIIKNILVDKHEFAEDRVQSTINKLFKSEEEKKQTALNRWV